ncbi:MAG TPA: thioredoxin family protein [Chitinophagaceae bacterium]|nr:thioredoxin family protein [Chitinophagaceae bacterium]
MKRILLLLLPAVAILFMALRPAGEPLPIGSAIPNPDTKMKDISGKEISFKDAMKKNGLLVMFSCNTCPVVHKYKSRTLEVCRYAAGKDIGVILLNPNEASRGNGDSYEDMKEYARQESYDFSYAVDNNSVMADAFGATRTPEIFLFDSNRKLVYHGAIDDNSNSPDQVSRKHLVTAIDEMTGGKAVSVNKTRSVGCTIKRM